MLDFLDIDIQMKKDTIVVSPEFLVQDSKDLMIRGGDFYAVWDEDEGMWSTKEGKVVSLVDREIRKAGKDIQNKYPTGQVQLMLMKKARSGSIDRWHKYVQKQMRDSYTPLDERIIFFNTPVKKTDYVSKRLPYSLTEGSFDSYDRLISTLYDPEERAKIEWAIGAIISGDAKKIQKFEVLYGSAGTGKSTIFNIISKLFSGYTSTFDAKQLASANSAFALESFKTNPLVSIQHDGDLSRIEDNTKLNSIVSHEEMEVNEKFAKKYTARFNTFLFMGTNKPVKITEAKSGIIRRLIDVKPSGRKLPYEEYQELVKKIDFELGAIAYHCLKVYESMGEDYYEKYVPTEMIASTNDFYDFIDYYYDRFTSREYFTLSELWGLYQEYCSLANCFQQNMRGFRVELRNYFKDFYTSKMLDGVEARSVYGGFIFDKFVSEVKDTTKKEVINKTPKWLRFMEAPEGSLFDRVFGDCPAQYSKEDGSPRTYWAGVKTTLKDLNTHELHWVKLPENVITIDFDIPGPDGKKNLDANIEAAAMWLETYAELSKSGCGIHLTYFYDGDVSKLSRVAGDNIEIKVSTGNAALRRKLSMCNDIPIATINSGLPMKGEKKKVVDWDGIKNEKQIRTMIQKNMNKEYHSDTTSSVDYIKKILDDAYESGVKYDVSDLQPLVQGFAMKSTNQRERCVNTVGKMHFASEIDISKEVKGEVEKSEDDRLVFIDVEVYKNLFVVVWKYEGDAPAVHMINPKPWEVEELFRFNLVGFNSNGYDAYILWAAAMGKSNIDLYNLSQAIIMNGLRVPAQAKKIFYTDVYDFCTEKMSLKKWEIKLGIHHQEMGIPWDEEVPEELWPKVCEYCENDVRATEAVFNARQGDFRARQFQVDLVGLLHPDEGIQVTVNDSTNELSKRIIFGRNREPQNEFNWRDLSKPVGSDQYEEYRKKFGPGYRFRVFDREGLPLYRDFIPGEVLPEGYSILPFFSGYSCVLDENGKYVSTYLGETIGEGGRVFSVKGYYSWVWDGDVSSQHPNSMKEEVCLGPRYQPIMNDILAARVAIKHRDFEKAGTFFNGALKPYLNEEMAGDLAQALKIVINSIYGLTKAAFKNEFRDPRNFDNIVAKRGALFMTLLKREVEKRGFMVCHIKTDSIKIPQASEEIKDFVVKFGREFGYEFETEGVFVKFALFNDAAYVAKTEDGEYITKADQFKKEKQPYLFKTLFSHEPIEFSDFCETKSVSKGALYLDMNEKLGEDLDEEVEKARKKLDRMADKCEKILKDKYPGISDNWITRKLGYLDADDEFCEFPEITEQKKVIRDLLEEAPKRHDMRFVGRVGLFTPVIDGVGGGKLYRIENGKKYNVGGCSDYRWLESEFVREHGMEDKVDRSYYTRLVDKTIADFNDMVDFEWFVSDELPPHEEIRMIDIPAAEWPKSSSNEPVPGFINIPEGSPEEVPFEEI